MRVADRNGQAPPPEAPTTAPTDEGPMRGELRRQIAFLERDIAKFVALNCPHEPQTASKPRGPGVLATSELEEIRDELLALRTRLHDAVVAEMAARNAAREARRAKPRPWRKG